MESNSSVVPREEEAGPVEPLVSVLIPVFNMAQHIQQAIQSATGGSFVNLEVIVIDDGSTDRTEEHVLPFLNPEDRLYDPRVKYLRQHNQGKAVALNNGLRIAAGHYITILDADDALTANSIAARYAAARDKDADMVIGDFEVFNHDHTFGKRTCSSEDDPGRLLESFYFKYKTPFHFNACLLSRDLVGRVGLFDERLKRCQDIDYSMRCLKEARHVGFADIVVYRYRKHRSSARDRLFFRIRTIYHRSLVLQKNVPGAAKLVVVPYGFVMDAAKMVYELMGNYKK